MDIAQDLLEESVSQFDDTFWQAQQDIYEDNLKKFDATVETISRNLRKGDWAYLNRHPEVRAIIRVIVTEAIRKQPENIFNFTANLFNCNNHKRLIKMINKQLKWIKKQVKVGSWSPADGVMVFTESSTSSMKRENCYTDFKMESSDEIFIEPNKCPENLKPSY